MSATTSSADPTRWAVDTSVAVPYLDAAHTAHASVVTALAGRRATLAGHAAFEAFAVLTRLPEPSRILASDARRGLDAAFPEPCWLAAAEQAALADRLGVAGIVGGAVYDALVGEAARTNHRVLLTRDRRARPTYDLLGVAYEFLA